MVVSHSAQNDVFVSNAFFPYGSAVRLKTVRGISVSLVKGISDTQTDWVKVILIVGLDA